MNAISSLSPSTNPYLTASPSGPGQFSQDFSAIGSALQSGDITKAQGALASFQKDLQGASPTAATQPFGKNSQANSDFQTLVSALKSGDAAGAQKAFTSLKTDLQPAESAVKSARKGHHHHHASEAVAAATTASTSSTTTGVTGGNTLNVTA